MNLNPSAVVKLGGSLLTLPDLAERLFEVVRLLQPRKVLIVVGGGAAADEIRRLNGTCRLSATQAHWDAIAAMALNADVLSRVFGCLPVVSNQTEAVAAWQQHDAVLLNTNAFLRVKHAQHSGSLHESWDVTSDSIAGFVALHWPAEQLVFCKSRDLTSHHIEKLCQDALLDEWFPNLVTPLQQSGVQLRWLNLRDAPPNLERFYRIN